MEFVRDFDESKAVPTGFRGYNWAVVSRLESAYIIGSWIDAGGCGPGLHYHEVDQAYYLVRGESNVQVGDETHHITPGTFVHIPAGTAHRNWNDSTEQEFHIEIIVPAPSPAVPIALFVDSPADAPGSTMAPTVRTVVDEDFFEPDPEGLPGLKLCDLVKNDNSVMRVFRMGSGGAGPGTHIHDFDQYYMVLEGVLQVEVALERHEVQAGSLVLLPAGVPHRQWNDGPQQETHLALISPAPRDGAVWDRGVDFAFNGREHS